MCILGVPKTPKGSVCSPKQRVPEAQNPRPASGVQPSWPSPPGSQWLGAHIVGDARPPAAQPDGDTGLRLPKVPVREQTAWGNPGGGALHGHLGASGPGPGRSLDAGPTSQPLGTRSRADGAAFRTPSVCLCGELTPPWDRRLLTLQPDQGAVGGRLPRPCWRDLQTQEAARGGCLRTSVPPSALSTVNQGLVTGAAAEMEEFVHRTGAWAGPQDGRSLAPAGRAGGQARV